MTSRRAVIGSVSLATVFVVLFLTRHSLIGAWRESRAPEIPESVGWKDVKRDGAVDPVDVDSEEVVAPDVVPDLVDVPADEPDSTPTSDPPPTLVPSPAPEPAPAPEVPSTDTADESELPATINLAIPFTSQAPDGVWNALHEDACEEAAVYMVIRYYQGATETVIAVDEANAELERLVNLETSMGFGVSISAQQVASMIEAAYDGFRTELVTDPTVEDLKRLLANGHPIVVPAAGRQLGNPNFSGEGPLYHMYTLRGYTEEGFITNEPGTRVGRNYFYSTETVMNAIRDWNGGDVYNGARVVIVIYPE